MTTEITELMKSESRIRQIIYQMKLNAQFPPLPSQLVAIRDHAGDLVAETSRQLKALGKP